jgi:M6 family metalloprotease-like protein
MKRIASAFLSVLLVLTSVSIAPAAQVSDTVQTQSVSTRKYANIVVFVDFKDTTHEHEKTELGKCYKEDPKITEYFEGDEEHPRALKQYVSNISYGQLNVQNIIPQYDSENNKIEPYVLSNDVSYYGDRTVGTSGPALGDTRMVKEISELLAKDSRFPKDAIVDYDGDGCVDNLMIITACEKGNSNSQMYGHMSTYAGTDEINSKKIGSYTVIPEGSAYFGLSETGVVIHEFMHTLGYPDLYVNTNVSGVVPVGQWDIMAMVSKFIQYPLAYFRSAYSGWFDIPTVTESKKNCSIYAASSTTFDTRNNQAVILRTDYSSNEFFVVEYRKQKAKYDVASHDDKSYESKIYGSGLIIYRINASLTGGNMYGPPYKAYVFRPGDSILNGYEKADYTNLDKSFLSAESGRTSYGTHDKNAGIADNAITYSDGTNSGIVIENVGSASGDTITFDISFADDGQEGRWITESTDTLGLSLSDIETYTDSEQNKYFIANIGDGYGYATKDTVLFKYSDGAWSKITDGPKATNDGKSIVTYNGDVYISYLDTNFYARVDKWNGSSWQNIYKASGYSDNVSLVAGSEGIYFSYTSQDNSNIYAYKYDGNTLKNLSDNILAGAVSSMPANAAISVDADENIFVEYRDTANNSNIYIKKYNQIDNSWNTVLNGSIQANEVVLSNNNGKLYLFKKGTAFDTVKDSYLYSLDYANSAKEWTQVGTNSITDKGVNNASLCFDGDNVYVGTTASDNITFVSGLVDGEWHQLGTNVSIQDISGLNISYGNSKIYATYLDSDTGKVVVRSYEVKSADKPEQPVEVPITEVQLGREALDMYEGDTFKLTATVLPVNTTDSKDISWSSNNEAVATVSEDGTVTAKSVGTAVITATSTNGKTASCTVTVEKKLIPITEVSLSESAVGIIEGNTHKLTATVLPENTTDSKSISWSSNNEAVATVSEDGTITAKSVGTAVITATSTNGKTADCTVTVSKKEIPITEVYLDKSSATLTEGDSTTLVATVLPENTTDGKSIKWSSSNVAVATVDLMGKVTAKSAGTAIITATSENGKTASCTVTVEKKLIPITEVSLSESAVGIIEGNTHKLTATVLPENTTDSKSISWSSNNEAVATVSEDGTITAKSVGTAVITATSTNGKTADCTVTVSKKEIPITEVYLDKSSATLTEGDSTTLVATVLPENTTDGKSIKWSSSNVAVATVDLMGKVTAKSAGTAIITATSENGKTASCTVTVEKKLIPITEVLIDKSSATLTEGDSTTLTATVLPENTTDRKDISWSSSNNDIATVDTTGHVEAKQAGTVIITATSSNGKTAECTVTVEKKLIPITEVSLSESAVGIIEGNTHKLTATVLPENTTDSKSVSWGSSNEAVATVSEDGTITAKSAGTAVITATSTNGKTVGCTVTVSKKEIPIVDVALNRTSATITEGDILNLTATVLPENTTESKNIGWSSSNNDIATVDSTGKVTAKQAGTVVITATSSNGKTASCTITVEKKEIPITEVVLNKTSAAVDEGETIRLIATVYPENTTNGKSIKWSSNNNTVVTVDLMGNVTAKKAGTAIITATSENGVSASCTITVNKKDTYTGLRDVDGKLTYFNNGNVDTTYTGLVDYEDSTYYVRNGVVDITYTGFADYEDDRYYISEGVVDTEYTGLVQDGDDWLYVENGKVNSDFTGLTYYNDVWFYITNGKINWGYTGLVYYNDIWFYVSGGMIDWNYAGLVYYNDVWFYVSGGMIGWDYTGLAYFADTWFYISNGMLDWNYLGLTYYNDMWFVISGGTINWSYMGLVYYNDIWFYVSGGTINWDYEGLIYYRDTWFYVSGGCVDWTTAVVEYNGNKFYIQDGMVDWNFSGTIDYKGYTYHIVGGMVV